MIWSRREPREMAGPRGRGSNKDTRVESFTHGEAKRWNIPMRFLRRPMNRRTQASEFAEGPVALGSRLVRPGNLRCDHLHPMRGDEPRQQRLDVWESNHDRRVRGKAHAARSSGPMAGVPERGTT